LTPLATSVPQDISEPGFWADWLSVEELRAVTTKSRSRGLTILGVHYALYLLTLLGALTPLPIWLNLAFAIANGALIGLIFLIGHDAAHSAWVPGREANRWCARLAFLPSLHSRSLWEVVHNHIHHSYTNLKGVDYVWAPMSKAEYDAHGWPRRLLERFYRSLLGPAIYYWTAFWLPKLILPIAPEARRDWKRHLPDTLFVVGAGAALIFAIALTGLWLTPERPLWLILLVGWFVPFAIWNWLMALSIFLQHNHPQVPWFSDPAEWTFYNGAIRGAAHVELPFDFLALFKWVMLHNAHHVLPSVPLYNLTDAQSKLIEAYGEDVTQYRFSLPAYWRISRACKLFDYERKQWTDFAGHPTAEPIRLASPAAIAHPVSGPRVAASMPARGSVARPASPQRHNVTEVSRKTVE